MSIIKKILIFLLFSGTAFAQNSYYSDTVLGPNPTSSGGAAFVSFAQVRVCTSFSLATPCPNLASIFNAIDGTPLSVAQSGFGQLTADFLGRYSFQAQPGNYFVQVQPSAHNLGTQSKNITVGTGNTLAGSLILGGNNTYSGVNHFNGSNTFIAFLNNNPRLDGTVNTGLQSCYNAIPLGGGTCYVPTGYTEILSANLNLNKSGAGFYCEGTCTITMGSFQVVVPAGIYGFHMRGLIPYGGNANVEGFHFIYSGTTSAFLIGNSSGLTDREWTIENVSITLSHVNNQVGFDLQNVVYWHMNNVAVIGTQNSGQIGIRCDGTGNFCGTGWIVNPLLSFVGVGITGTGVGAGSMNAVNIIGGTIQTFATSPSIGIDIEGGFNNWVWGTDLESNTVAVKVGSNATENTFYIRSEANTNDFQEVAGATRNVGYVGNDTSTLNVSGAGTGTDNHWSILTNGDFNTIKAITANITTLAVSNLSTSGTILSTVNGAVLTNLVSGTGQKFIELANTGNLGFYYGIESSIGGTLIPGSAAYDAVLYSNSDLFLNFNHIKISKTISQYNSIATVGNGVPVEYANTASASTNTNIAATTLITTPAATSRYRASFYVDQTISGVACTGTTTIVLNIIFTDPQTGFPSTISLGTFNVATLGNGLPGNFVGQATFNLVAKASSNVQYSTTSYTPGSACTTNPSYQVYPTLEVM